jgi:cytochrome c556
MRKLLLLGILVLLVSLVAACGEDLKPRVQQLEQENTTLKGQVQKLRGEKAALENNAKELEELAGPPPQFLDRLYPPQAPSPVLFLEMTKLGGAMEGLLADMFEQDFANLPGDMDRFKAQYNKLRDEVTPEWQELYPLEPITALEQALATQDPAKIMPAVGDVGEVCGKCHGLYMVKVQQKYHWPDWEEVKFTNPLTKQDQPVGDFMLGMGVNFNAIGHNLQQGQLENARKNFQAFNAQFDAMRKGCGTEGCHDPDTERAYFVDKSVQNDINALGKALESTPPDAQAIPGLMQKIGQESCGECHLVHLPAASAQEMWEHMEK